MKPWALILTGAVVGPLIIGWLTWPASSLILLGAYCLAFRCN